MEISIYKDGSKAEAEATLAFEGEKVDGIQFSKEDFTGKAGESAILRKDKVAILIGLGKRAEFEDEKIRQAAATLVAASKKTSARNFIVKFPAFEKADDSVVARNFAEGALLASYDFSKFKEKKDDTPSSEGKTAFLKFSKPSQRAEDGLKLGKIMASASNYARDLNNEPGNVANPEFMAQKAIELSKKAGFSCKVINVAELSKMGLHGIGCVGGGSKTPGRLVVMEYAPAAKSSAKDPFVFVGKGITFDSGGISIKPSRGMELMKWDKSGACAVLGILKAASELKVNARVVGIIALAENMPSGTSARPGDIIRSGGKSIEVFNTDAEGRLVLSDALSYAREKYPGAKSVIDLATLTGACVIALGSVASGLMATDDKLAADIEKASFKTGERVWRLPMFPEFEQMIAGKQADIRNIAEPGGEGSTITAAFFLKNFIGKWPWAHLDIAGTAYQTTLAVRNYYAWGPTGAGVRLCTQYLLDNTGK
ncbi:MAG: leucyl aminopeptidase [Candidatus Micrarchaeia archaeon]